MNDKTDQNSTNDPLDILLQEADAHIPDAGFTTRVMKNLPAKRAPRRSLLRYIILAVAIAASAIAAVWYLPPILEVTHTMRFITEDPMTVLLAVLPTLVVAGSLCVGIWRMVSEEAN